MCMREMLDSRWERERDLVNKTSVCERERDVKQSVFEKETCLVRQR